MIVITAGFLRIGVNYRRPGANDPVPPDEYQKLRHGLIASQQENVRIQMEATAQVSWWQERCHKLVYALRIAHVWMPAGTEDHEHVRRTLDEAGGMKHDVR